MWRKILNPFMIGLLRSPLHFLVSKHIMLISVKGRKSGKTYTTPLDYGRDGGEVLAITSQNYSWWKNLRGGGSADLLVAGQALSGQAVVSEDAETVLDTLGKMYPGRSGFEKFAARCVAIRVELAQ
jgi:hypothetical protein